MKKSQYLTLLLICSSLSLQLCFAGKLHEAIKTGNLQKVEELLNSRFFKPNVNATENIASAGSVYRTPLIMAISRNHYSIANLLIRKGADVNAGIAQRRGYITFKYKPIHVAINNENVKILKLLINNGANPTLTVQGKTPLDIARRKNNLEIILLLNDALKKYNSKTVPKLSELIRQSKQSEKGLIPTVPMPNAIKYPATKTHSSIPTTTIIPPSELTISHKLISISDFAQAIIKNDSTTVGIAIQQGINLELEIRVATDPKENTLLCYTPLSLACAFDNIDITRLLLKNGAKVDAQGSNTNTPLNNAILTNKPELINLLITHKANLNKQTPTKKNTALHIAIIKGHLEAAKALMDAGCDLSLKNSNNLTALQLAQEKNNKEIIKLIQDKQLTSILDKFTPLPAVYVKPKQTKQYQFIQPALTATKKSQKNLNESLFFEIKKGNLHAVKKLLLDGANHNAQQNELWTPLHLAATYGQIETAKLLINKGANPNAQQNEGWTPLHWATSQGHTAMAELLINNGADIAIQNNKRQTALNIAQSKPNKNVTSYPAIIHLLSKTFNALHAPAQPLKLVLPTLQPITSQLTLKLPINPSSRPVPVIPPKRHAPPINKAFIIDNKDITLVEKIGSGGFGDVYKGTWNYQTVAVKTLHMKNMSGESEEEFKQETSIWKGLRHPNIIQLFGICMPPDPYCMVMEYKPSGSLYDLLKSKTNLSWDARIQLGLDIGSALLYLHNNNIVHRDLKSLNILVATLDNKLRASLTDFGLSVVKQEITTATKIEHNQSTGTLLWMAPEIVDGHQCTKQSDLYAYGMVLYEIASRKIPFKGSHPSVISGMILRGKTPVIPEKTPKLLATIIRSCWRSQPIERPTISSILEQLNNHKSTGLDQPPINIAKAALPSAHLSSGGSSGRTSRKIKMKITKLLLLLDQAYPQNDTLDSEDTLYRKEIINLCNSFKGLEKLNSSQKKQFNNYKQSLLTELEDSDDVSSDEDPNMPLSTTILKS